MLLSVNNSIVSLWSVDGSYKVILGVLFVCQHFTKQMKTVGDRKFLTDTSLLYIRGKWIKLGMNWLSEKWKMLDITQQNPY